MFLVLIIINSLNLFSQSEDITIHYVDFFTFEPITVDAFNRFPEASTKDLEALYRIAYAEAGIDGKEGMKAVVWSIENRMQHPSWKGMGIFDIASQKGQFDGYQSKYYNIDTIPQIALEAVREAMAEKNTLKHSKFHYVYFNNAAASTCGWYFDTIQKPQQDYKITIGRHDYYPCPNFFKK